MIEMILKGFASLKMGLLGEKLGHSFSSIIHQKLADYRYDLYEVAHDELANFMTEASFNGLNVTIPYKKEVMPYLDSIDEKAQAIGAVNTIKNQDGRLIGYNTDYDGFAYLLHKNAIAVAGKKVLVLGNGGAAAPVREVLKAEKAREVVTISRKGENNYTNLAQHYTAEVIINTTPVGMYPHNGESVIDLKNFTDLEAVVDIIYNPLSTKLVLEAGELGIHAVGGLDMLIGQAIRACEIWTDQKIAVSEWDKIAQEIMQLKQNIVLVGMPGSGKSTLAKLLATALGRESIDMDELFLEEYNRSAQEVIIKDGEEHFRQLEHELVKKCGQQNGIIISSGGGVVTREENYFPLKQNGIIICLKRDIFKLPLDGRPISQNNDLEELYQKRKPLYERFSDFMVEVDDESKVTLKRVLQLL